MNIRIPPGFDWHNPWHWLAFGLGSGFSPYAPGTMGSLLGVVFFAPLSLLPLMSYLAWLLFSVILGIYVCEVTSRDLGVHDHSGIVFDEFVGQWLALLPLVITRHQGPLLLLAGFILFRFFDILKPWPIRWMDKHIGGGVGIMMDDVAAGLLAAAGVMLLIIRGYY